MASVNKVIIVGNLGRDPEIRYMPSCSDLHLKRGPASIQADSRPGITATDSPFKPALAANEPAFSRADRHFIRAN